MMVSNLIIRQKLANYILFSPLVSMNSHFRSCLTEESKRCFTVVKSDSKSNFEAKHLEKFCGQRLHSDGLFQDH